MTPPRAGARIPSSLRGRMTSMSDDDEQLTSADIFGEVLAEVEAEAQRKRRPPREPEKPLEDIERKLEELEKLKSVLTVLVDRCHGDDRPDCPILDDLAAVDKPALRDQAVGE